jgi:hypothetical protein
MAISEKNMQSKVKEEESVNENKRERFVFSIFTKWLKKSALGFILC